MSPRRLKIPIINLAPMRPRKQPPNNHRIVIILLLIMLSFTQIKNYHAEYDDSK